MNCKNCTTELSLNSEFCNQCGGKVIRNRLTFKNLFEHITETFFNYDNKLLRTFIDLFKKPEAVIDNYVTGIRKRYVNPISFFGLSLTISGLSVFIIKKFYLQYFDIVAWFSSLEIFSNPGSQKMLENYSTSETMEYSSLIFSAIVPVFGLLSWIIFYDKKYNLAEHIVIYIYSMSLISIISVFIGQVILFTIPTFYIPFVFLSYPLILLYHSFILKRLFKLSWLEIIVKTILFLILFFILYIVLGILSFVLSLINGSIDISQFTPKK